jgi:hypothetical protein
MVPLDALIFAGVMNNVMFCEKFLRVNFFFVGMIYLSPTLYGEEIYLGPGYSRLT